MQKTIDTLKTYHDINRFFADGRELYPVEELALFTGMPVNEMESWAGDLIFTDGVPESQVPQELKKGVPAHHAKGIAEQKLKNDMAYLIRDEFLTSKAEKIPTEIVLRMMGQSDDEIREFMEASYNREWRDGMKWEVAVQFIWDGHASWVVEAMELLEADALEAPRVHPELKRFRTVTVELPELVCEAIEREGYTLADAIASELHDHAANEIAQLAKQGGAS